MTTIKALKMTTAMMAATGCFTLTAAAQEVRLIGKDSNINVTGKLLSVKDGEYLVQTDIGEFIINQDLVTCEGDACPTKIGGDYALEIAAPDEIATSLIPILVSGYAATSLDAEVELLNENGVAFDPENEEGHEYGDDRDLTLVLTDIDGEGVADFSIHTGDGSSLFEALAKKEASLIITETSSRRADRALVSDGGGGDLRDFDQERVIAVDGFTIAVNPLNGISSLSQDQLISVFSGEVSNWSEVGGSDAPINVYTLDPTSEGFHHIENLLFRKSKKKLSAQSTVSRNNSGMINSIMDDVSGIALAPFSAIRDARAVPLMSACGILEEPSIFNIKAEEYELQDRVIVYSRSDIDGYGRELVDFLDTESLDGLVAKAGFINLEITTAQQERAAERLAAELEEGENNYEVALVEDLLKNMNTRERLSTTFRFAPGAKRFDNKGRRDLARMVKYLSDTKPSEVMVVGFTDNKGPFDPNLNLSTDRAQFAMEFIQDFAKNGELDGINMVSKGYGELSPVACNTDPRGRATNRRVEIWVKE